MAYDSASYVPRQQSEREEAVVIETIQEYSELATWRATFESHWEEIAEILVPSQRNTFQNSVWGAFSTPGEKKTDRQVDATGMLALNRFSAICDSLLTPRNSLWHTLSTLDPVLKKNREVRLWFEEVTRLLFMHRYAPLANFSGQNQQSFQSLGAFGTGSVFVDRAYDANNRPIKGIRYKALPLGELLLRENHQGLVDGFIRVFRMTAGQVHQKWPDRMPPAIRQALDKQSQTPFTFLHRVCPRADYDPTYLDQRGMRFHSIYVSLDAKMLMQEGGYNSFPLAVGRYDQAPGEVYGRGPGMSVLPSLKTLNAQKRTFLKQGHRAADPVLLTADDGLLDGFSMRPGALNKGGMSAEGRALVGVLPSGNIQVNEVMMNEEKSLIQDAFLVSLFQIMTESPQMTATEVIERTNEKGILLAPTMGRQQSEYLGPLIDRELDLLSELGLLPPMPDILREVLGDYHVTYTSPLARAARAQEVAGVSRTMENVLQIVNATGDPSPLDTFDFDTMIPEIAEIQGVPERWMASPQMVQQKRAARQQAVEQQQKIAAAPAAAAMVKAGVAAHQAGVDPGSLVNTTQNIGG